MSGSGPSSDPPEGRLRPTSALALVGWALVGGIGGWGLHPLCDRLGWVPPVVPWLQALALLLLAAILVATAWQTHRMVQVRRERLPSHQAVNRLVLARACAIVGALVGAGYVGYGLSWIGDPAGGAHERLLHSLVAGGGGLVAAAGALFLERACRVRTDDD